MSTADPVWGIDVSHWQQAIDMNQVKKEGYEFAVVKATEGPYRDGTKYTDDRYRQHTRNAQAAGLIVGAYHFLVETPAKAQVDHFLSTVGDVSGKIVMVDFEEYAAPYGYLTPSNATLKSFISELRRRIGDHPIVVYSSRGFWNGGDPTGPASQFGAVTTWDAYYLTMDQVDPGPFYGKYKDRGWGKPWGDQEPMIWQFTPAGKVAGLNVDVNAFKGTKDELLALAGLSGSSPAPNPAPTPNDALPAWVAGPLEYLEGAKGGRYVVWESGRFADSAPAWVGNAAPPPAKAVRDNGAFCFPGDTRVVAGEVERSYRRPYSGEVVTIKTARGNRLTGTPNHPVLTEKGWVALKTLKKGDHVVSSSGLGELAGAEPYDQQRPFSLEEMHRFLADTGYVERDLVTPLDFHGDGRDGEVDIVVTERLLDKGLVPTSFEQLFELGLADSSLSTRSTGEVVAGHRASALLVGSSYLSELFGGGEPAVLEDLSFGDTSQRDPSLFEATVNSKRRGPVMCGDGAGRVSGQVLADNGISDKGEAVDRSATRPTPLPVEPGAFANGAAFDSGLVEAGPDTGHGHTEAFGYLRRGVPLCVSPKEIFGVDVVAPLGFGLDTGHAVDLTAGTQPDTGFEEPSPHGILTDANLTGDLFEGLPADVHFDEVVDVDVGVFEGHVYNLQTSTGHYVANNIIVHNCAGLPNLAMRKNGIPHVDMSNAWYGGVLWYGNYFVDQMDLAVRLKPREDYPPGTLFIRRYTGPALSQQGHVAIMGRHGRLLQSDVPLGINEERTLAQTQAFLAQVEGGGFQWAVLPENWLKPKTA